MSSKQQPTKAVHALRSPYPESTWPHISPELEDAILDILMPLLVPIGQYRESHLQVSQGKHRKKRRRKNDSARSKEAETLIVTGHHGVQPQREEPREEDVQTDLRNYLTVGFNTTVRHLEALSQRRPGDLVNVNNSQFPTSMVAVFVCTSVLPQIMAAPFPMLVATASRSGGDNKSTRLIQISRHAASRVAEALKQPRVNVLGLLAHSPGMEELYSLLRNEIEPVKVPWMQDTMNPRYLSLKIHSHEITVSHSHSKAAKRKRSESEMA